MGDNFERFATDRFNDPRPWWFYLPVVAGGLLPWTPLVLVWLGPLTQFLRRRRDIGTIDLRLLLWAVLPLVFYSLSVGKQPRYVLPVLPPLALLLAVSIVERTQEWRGFDGAAIAAAPRPAGGGRVAPERPVLRGAGGAALSRAAAADQRQSGLHDDRGGHRIAVGGRARDRHVACQGAGARRRW